MDSATLLYLEIYAQNLQTVSDFRQLASKLAIRGKSQVEYLYTSNKKNNSEMPSFFLFMWERNRFLFHRDCLNMHA